MSIPDIPRQMMSSVKSQFYFLRLTRAFIFLLSLTLVFPAFALVSLEGEYVSPEERAAREKAAAVQSLTDGKAVVDEVEGKAFLTKSGNPIQVRIKEGDVIEAGDSIYTEKGAGLTISFDDEKLNVIKIPAENKATFVSIEPTDIRLEDGSVFSAVDGLAEGSAWKVTTPAAVVAVRGTTFEVSYSAESGEFDAVTFEDEKTEKNSAIEIQSQDSGESIRIAEGKQLSFSRGQVPRMDLVRAVVPERAARGMQMREKVQSQREKNRQIREEKRKKLDEAAGQVNPPNGPGGPRQPGHPDGGADQPDSGLKPLSLDGTLFPREGTSDENGVRPDGLPDEKLEKQNPGVTPLPPLSEEGSSALIRRRPMPVSERPASDLPPQAPGEAAVKEMPRQPINHAGQPGGTANGLVPAMQKKDNSAQGKMGGMQKGAAKPPARPASRAVPAKRN